MRLGIGIDTGGTCTDGVIYDLEKKEILASVKTPTTKEDLSIGIGKALDLLPREYVEQVELLALSTTLATNACVENKGSRGKVIFLGIDEDTVKQTAVQFGLPLDDTLIFIPCKETLQGEIIEEPDWQQVERQLKEALADCQAVGIVELFAAGTGAALEKKTREIVERMGIPTVCGYELFQEKNVVGRGAGALLNARLLSVIAEFLQAVKKAMQIRDLEVPVVIVRSDGSLMNEEFSQKRPIETLLCGPVASVMGAAELHQVMDGVVIDMGGTTTDISMVKAGVPVRSQDGITVGNWKIYVKGMYVDTFGLGGDTEVSLNGEGKLELGSRRIMPLCMAARSYPHVLEILQQEMAQPIKRNSWRKNIYVGLKDIRENTGYSEVEKRIAQVFYQKPMTLIELEQKHRISLVPGSLKRLIDEGVIMPCGITPTDAMHVLGDYRGYDVEASNLGIGVVAEMQGVTTEEVCQNIYECVCRKLYCNIVRILLWDKYPKLKNEQESKLIEPLVEGMYRQAVKGKKHDFLNIDMKCDVPLIGVGGPIAVFLPKVAKLLGTEAFTGSYSGVANALGAIVGNVEVCMEMEIVPNIQGEDFRVSGNGESFCAGTLEEAKILAAERAKELARAEAIRRGAVEQLLTFREKYEPVEAYSNYGNSIFISAKVKAYASSAFTSAICK